MASLSTFAPKITQCCVPLPFFRSVRETNVLSENQSLDSRLLLSTLFCKKCILAYVCLPGSNLRWQVVEPLESRRSNSYSESCVDTKINSECMIELSVWLLEIHCCTVRLEFWLLSLSNESVMLMWDTKYMKGLKLLYKLWSLNLTSDRCLLCCLGELNWA